MGGNTPGGKSLTRGERKRPRKSLPPAEPEEHKVKDLEPATPKPIDHETFQWSVKSLDRDYDGDWDWNLAPKETHELLDLLSEMSGSSELRWG